MCRGSTAEKEGFGGRKYGGQSSREQGQDVHFTPELVGAPDDFMQGVMCAHIYFQGDNSGRLSGVVRDRASHLTSPFLCLTSIK